ncbi:MAG: glycosyltransferase [Bacteroidia bacterium]|nr:glycosyltransferase [Bacteroidia bacterium]
MDYLLESDFLAPPVVNVSVLCANYNNGHYLPDLIDSIHQSTVRPEEFIIIDDGSTDKSLEILEAYRHIEYLKVISLPKNTGIAHALNAGLKYVSGKYIMRVDADDYVDHTRIEKQYEYLEKHPDADLVGSNVTYFENGTGKLINHSNFPIGSDYIMRRYLRGENGVLHGSVMIRKICLEEVLYNETLDFSVDYDLFARMVRKGYSLHNLNESLTYVRLHKTNTAVSLAFPVIEMNFRLRDEIFQTHTRRFHIFTYYIHLHYYRKYLFETSSLLRYLFLFISVIFMPSKLLRRFTGWRWVR